jgi:hypothetical protein
MLVMDQRTMQIKYRIPASDIFKLSLSPFSDDIAVFHVRAVSSNWNLNDQSIHSKKVKQMNLFPGVNFTNILWAAFAPIYFCQKNYNAKLWVEKMCALHSISY